MSPLFFLRRPLIVRATSPSQAMTSFARIEGRGPGDDRNASYFMHRGAVERRRASAKNFAQMMKRGRSKKYEDADENKTDQGKPHGNIGSSGQPEHGETGRCDKSGKAQNEHILYSAAGIVPVSRLGKIAAESREQRLQIEELVDPETNQ